MNFSWDPNYPVSVQCRIGVSDIMYITPSGLIQSGR